MPSATIVTLTFNPAVELLIEVPDFKAGQHVRGRRIDLYPGGRGITVSRVLARLGSSSITTGLVGDIERSMVEQSFRAVGPGRINNQLLSVNVPTRQNVTIVDPINDMETNVREIGFPIGVEDVRRLVTKIGLLSRPGSIVCFCGSLAPGIGLDVFRAMVQQALDAGSKVVIDTVGEALEAVRDLRVWLVRAGRTAAYQLTGEPVRDRAGAARAAARIAETAEVAVVTVDQYGAAIATAGQGWEGHVGLHPGRVQNTVGCADCFLAGLLHEWTRTSDWLSAFQFGLAVATANATTVRTADITPEAIEEFVTIAVVERSRASVSM